MLVYSRDALAGPLHSLHVVLNQVASGDFRPDAPRGQQHGQAADYEISSDDVMSEEGAASASEAELGEDAGQGSAQEELLGGEVLSDATAWGAPVGGVVTPPASPRSTGSPSLSPTPLGSVSPLSEQDLLLAWGPPEPTALALLSGLVRPRQRRIELEISRLSRKEALRVCALLRAAGRPAAPSLDTVEFESDSSSEEADIAVGGPAGVTFIPPEEEVANAENALDLTTEGAADAEPPDAAARGSRPMRDQSDATLVMHRTRRTVHRSTCRFARRAGAASMVSLLAEPAADWQRCRFCCPP